LTTKRKKQNDRIIYLGVWTAILLIFISVSGCATNGDDNQPATDNDVMDRQQGAQNANMGTLGVENTYIAADYDFSSDTLGYNGCIIFTVPLTPGDKIEVAVTTDTPVDFISGDYNFYLSVLTNFGKIDTLQDFTLYESEILQNSNSYYLSGPVDRNSFNLVVRNPDGSSDNIRGHIKVVVHSKFANSLYDTQPAQAVDVSGMQSYVIQEWDFTSEKYGATNCISEVYLMPGDIVEASVTTEKPEDFISGDYNFDLHFLMNSGRTDASNSFKVYQSESYSDTNSYYLLKQIDRKWFVLAVKNPAGDYQNIRGHKKIVVYSKYTEQDHKDAFQRDYGRVINHWSGVAKEATTPPYTMGYSRPVPANA
jgi:hypothetical protein